jgi:3-phenylpropionate/trans-cinnamate dioxygenase ferredoxin subunit
MPGEAKISLSGLAEGTMKAVEVDGEEVVVAKVGGQCFAFGGICTHDGGPMIDGELYDGKVTCPWHFTEFDVRTGEVLGGMTDEPLPVYEVEVEGDEVRIRKP